MKPEYAAFLDELMERKRLQFHESQRAEVERPYLARAECNTWTVKFVEKFPHLKRVAGFYGSPNPDVEEMNATEHWWCVEPDGTIVDPTAEQFRPGGTYTVFDATKHKIKIGRCMNCGDDIFGLKHLGPKCVCGSVCSKALEDYYNSGGD